MKRYVYFARAEDGTIKIGCSHAPKLRTHNLRCELLACYPGGFEAERREHDRWADYVAHGNEWFTPSDSLMKRVRSVAKTGLHKRTGLAKAVHVRVDRAMFQALKKASERLGITIDETARRAVRKHYKVRQ